MISETETETEVFLFRILSPNAGEKLEETEETKENKERTVGGREK